MQIVTLTAPTGAARVAYGKIFVGVEADGTVRVPQLAAAELIAAGCILPVGAPALPATPLAQQLAAAGDDELRYYLKSRLPRRVSPGDIDQLASADLRTRAAAIAAGASSS